MNCAEHVESVRRIPGSWVWGLAHVVGDKLVRAVVVRVQGPNVVANQEGARLCAHVDDQFGRCQGVVGVILAEGLVYLGPNEVAEVVLARGLVVVEADLDVRGDVIVVAQVVVRDHLLPGALLPIGVALGVVHAVRDGDGRALGGHRGTD